MNHSIYVFLDEGSLNGKAAMPSASAVVTSDPERLRRSVAALARKISLEQGFRIQSKAGKFATIGFHHSEDGLDVRNRMISEMKHWNFNWWCSSIISGGAVDPYQSLAEQYSNIIRMISQKYKGNSIEFTFEQNSRMNGKYPKIVQRAVTPTTVFVTKIAGKDERILGISDYCISVATAALRVWPEVCCGAHLLPSRHEYRSLVDIETRCSLLYSFDHAATLSSRRRRLRDHSYFDVTGHHSPCCPVEGIDKTIRPDSL